MTRGSVLKMALFVAGALAAVSALLGAGSSGSGAVSILSPSGVIENFDTLSASTSPSSLLPSGWYLTELNTGTAADGQYVVGTGSGNAGGAYSFGDASATDRALGSLGSGTVTPIHIGAKFSNDTSSTITSATISYTGEMWRRGPATATDLLTFAYSTDATNLTTGTFVDFASLNFTSPGNTCASAAGLTNGNTANCRIAISATIPGLSIASGQSFWIRWTDVDTTGSDDGLAVDDFSISLVATPSLSLTPATLPAGAYGTPYSQTLTIQNNQGQSCTFSATGTPPAGLSLNSPTSTTVDLSGTPTAPGSTNFGISADCGSAGSVNQPYSLTISPPPFLCESGVKTSTAIHGIQGTGATSPQVGTVVDVEGIVVGDFQGAAGLRGFYLQEPDATADANPLTSEGVFVFDNAAGIAVNPGDRVRVRGTVAEFASSGTFLGGSSNSSLTEIGNLQNEQVCSSGNAAARVGVTLPVNNVSDLERYEGMAVEFAQTLRVTGNFNLGTLGQVDLAPSVLFTPTSTPGSPVAWSAQVSLNQRSVIALDDASTLSNVNLYPTIFPQGGLSPSNTLRSGDVVNAPLVGVLDDRFGQYRVQTLGGVTFQSANPRPAVPVLTSTGSYFYRAVSANVLNFFTTFGSRGAANQTEFDHQKTKMVEALFAMDGDIYGLTEVQNSVSGNTGGAPYTNAAVQSIVDGLNCKASAQGPLCTTPAATLFAFVDSTTLGANGNGTDAIRNAIVYRTDRMVPVGGPAAHYQNDGNRPTLAQTFTPATGTKTAMQTFTFVVSHFKSKGSSCGAGNDDPLQGNCNAMRLSMATNVVTWLASNPTQDPGSAPRRQLLAGDFNAYYGEDPIQYFVTRGFTNLINSVLGPAAYSYNFGSQAGYLDHGFANSAMNSLVKSVAEWHNNADEPASLQALDSNSKSAAAQAAYYAPDPYAASDHDPIVIGFNPLAGDLNDDGVVNAADQQLLTAALGRSAATGDRRFDYDGDGVITANDVRIWTGYYRAFVL